MACLKPDGTLTESALRILDVVSVPLCPDEIAKRTDLPLYRVRSALREMSAAGLLVRSENAFVRAQNRPVR